MTHSALNVCGLGQRRIIRSNCFDSLDRTNMAQAVIAGRALEIALCRLDVLLPRRGLSLSLASAADARALNHAWADNGDELAWQYAGSGTDLLSHDAYC